MRCPSSFDDFGYMSIEYIDVDAVLFLYGQVANITPPLYLESSIVAPHRGGPKHHNGGASSNAEDQVTGRLHSVDQAPIRV